ncbi:YbjQ family protein [Vibrio harveyi]
MNFEKVLISTTNSIIDDWYVSESKGIVTSSVVSGTNIFRDIFAGFRDVIGGKSQSYTNKIEDIKQEALEGLKEQAMYRSCNAILGVSIDVDEISGGGKSMLMVTAVGTAVVVKPRAQ